MLEDFRRVFFNKVLILKQILQGQRPSYNSAAVLILSQTKSGNKNQKLHTHSKDKKSKNKQPLFFWR